MLGIVLLALFFPLSAIIFPEPQVLKPYVVNFLLKEREMLEGLSFVGWFSFISAVLVFLWLLAAALWRRSFWYGVAVANLGGAIKLLVGIFLWDEVGHAAVLPTIATAVIFNAVAIACWWNFKPSADKN